MTVCILDKFSLLAKLEDDVKNTIENVFVFSGSHGAIYITKDDDVFGVGKNSEGCLGTGDDKECPEPRKIEELSQKQIQHICFGWGFHYIALSASGTVYSWGKNDSGQLGVGSCGEGLFPVQVITELSISKIIQVACSCIHSLALTEKGEVFTWGATINDVKPSPVKVAGGIENKCVAAIACGVYHSIALLDNGEVYFWGTHTNSNFRGTEPGPSHVMGLAKVITIQVVCGCYHTLALTDKGEIYSWGENDFGQLGTGSFDNTDEPKRIETDIRFVEIVAYNNISAAITQKGDVFMWGDCKNARVTKPFQTEFQTLDEVFSFCTWRLCPVVQAKSVTGDTSRSFDDSETSDVKFITEGGDVIHCHKIILKIRCNHLRVKFETDCSSKESIEVKYPYRIYRAFLYFLYSGTIDLKPEECIELLELATSYGQPDLRHCCEEAMKKGITVRNAALLYDTAVKYGAKELEEYCFRFSKFNLSAVAQTEAFGELDKSVIRRFINKAARKGAFKY